MRPVFKFTVVLTIIILILGLSYSGSDHAASLSSSTIMQLTFVFLLLMFLGAILILIVPRVAKKYRGDIKLKNPRITLVGLVIIMAFLSVRWKIFDQIINYIIVFF